MRCAHFLNPQRISIFPVLYHFKEQKEEIGRKWCRTFETNLRFSLLKKLDISKIAVLKEFTFKTGFQRSGYKKNVSFECRTFGKNFRYRLPKKVHFLRMRFLNEFTFKTAIYAKSERPAGRSKISQLQYVRDIGAKTERSSRFARAITNTIIKMILSY